MRLKECSIDRRDGLLTCSCLLSLSGCDKLGSPDSLVTKAAVCHAGRKGSIIRHLLLNQVLVSSQCGF